MSKSMDAKQNIIDANGWPVVVLKRPRCPKCGALNKKPYKTITDGERIEQRRLCLNCGQKFFTVAD